MKGALPVSELPAYIRACAHNPDPARPRYWVYTWKLASPEHVTRRPYECGSWRCPWGPCAKHEAHVCFARMKEAFASYDRESLVFVVLTLDGDEHRRAATSLADVYRQLRQRVERWQKRMRRQLDAMGLSSYGSEWCATVEAHRSDVPHVNLLIVCPSWARWLSERYIGKRIAGLSHREACILEEPFSSHLRACGFGWRSTAEVPRGKDAVSGYLTKLAAEAEQTHGEMAKRSQLPLKAPKGFRRLRSGVGFLPPRHKRGDVSGTIVRRVWTSDGDEEVRPLVQSQKLEYQRVVDRICELEQRLAWGDETERVRDSYLRRIGVPTGKSREQLTTSHRLDLSGRAPERGPPMRWAAPAPGAGAARAPVDNPDQPSLGFQPPHERND